ncbi:hypothetical protein DY000_02060040 [Brassica cretica]|uniref:Uncharacterized protein n=1 Tax=Brassica cretica TaxID=69181 RepID=A0ABQ7AQN7_BRACR|nr:hypothetical protein DY000_02060040 [Brassica cretica]
MILTALYDAVDSVGVVDRCFGEAVDQFLLKCVSYVLGASIKGHEILLKQVFEHLVHFVHLIDLSTFQCGLWDLHEEDSGRGLDLPNHTILGSDKSHSSQQQ